MAGASILNGITSFVTGGSTLTSFASQLVPFGKAMKEYSQIVAGIDASAITSSTTAAQALSVLANGLPNTGGLVSLFVGDNTLTSFAEQLIPFGKAMNEYSLAISGIDANSIINSATAAKSLAELANNIPNIGGLASIFVGDNSLTSFARQLVPFGQAMKSYSTSIAGIDPNMISSSATAAKSLAELANNIPNTGGLVSLFVGDNNLATFGEQLPIFGNAMKEYSLAITGINAEAITASANAAASLSTLAESLPNTGGLVSLFTGDNSLVSFAEQLPAFGRSLLSFSMSVEGINAENIISASNATKAIAQMSEHIPNQGGLVAWFTGDNSIASFASQLPVLGRGLLGFSTSVAGINVENITAASGAAKSLAQMCQYIPSEGGIKAWFTGETSIANFANKLPMLGAGLQAFSTSISGINSEGILSASNAAKALAQMTSYIPTEGGIKAWFSGETSIAKFANDLPILGKGLKGFSTSVAGINAENITAASSAAKSLAQMTSYIPTEGGIKAWFTGETNVANFADKLPSLGKGLKGFSDSISGINPGNVTAAASAAKTLAEMTKTVPKNTDNLESFGAQLVTFGGKLKKYFASTAGISAESISTVKKAIESVKTSTTGLNANTLKQAAEGITHITKSLRSMSGITANTTSGFVAAMKNLASVNVSNIANKFSSAGSKLSNAGKTMSNALSRGLKSGQSGVKSIASSMANSIAKAFSSESSDMTKAGTTLVNALAKGITSKKNSIKTAGKTLATSAKNGVEEGKNGMKSAGKDLGDGLVSGINSKKKAAYDAGYALGQQAVKGEKDGQKSNSPSKLTIQAGEWLGEGLIIGIKRLGSAVYSAANNMGERATTALSSALSRVGTLLDSDMDIQPTIAPVVDLSNVENSIGVIGGMFGRTMTIGANANINAISSMMNRRNQNGVNDDIVSAIDRLRKDLSNTGGDSYQINGITYDDGSNVADAIKTIVRAAKVERRI